MTTRIRLQRTKAFTCLTEFGGRERHTKTFLFKHYADYYRMIDDQHIWEAVYKIQKAAIQHDAPYQVTGIDTTSNEGLRLNQALLMDKFRSHYKKALEIEEPVRTQLFAKAAIFSVGLIAVQEEMIKRKIFFFDEYKMSDN